MASSSSSAVVSTLRTPEGLAEMKAELAEAKAKLGKEEAELVQEKADLVQEKNEMNEWSKMLKDEIIKGMSADQTLIDRYEKERDFRERGCVFHKERCEAHERRISELTKQIAEGKLPRPGPVFATESRSNDCLRNKAIPMLGLRHRSALPM